MSAIVRQPGTAIRPLSVEDIEAVMVIENSAYDFPWTPGIFSDCLRVGYSCWCYEQDGELLGYVVMSIAAGESHVLNLTVDPGSQRRGIGTKLMKHLMQLARRYNADMVMLEVRPSNKSAIAMYQRLGFNQISTRHNYYPSRDGREDALIFAYNLIAE